MVWTLDPADVRVSWSGHSRIATGKGPTRYGGRPARESMQIELMHGPTGISVQGEAPGPFTRAEAKQARARLTLELMQRLESEVAQALRVPGRRSTPSP